MSLLGWAPVLVMGGGLLLLLICAIGWWLSQDNEYLPPPQPDSRNFAFRDYKNRGEWK